MIKIYMTGYNSEELIHEAIKSIIHQTFTNWELQIIIDPKEGSRTGEYAKNYESSKIKVHLNETRMGLMHNVIAAINMMNPADDDIIVCVDSDDKLASKRVLQKVWETYDNNKSLYVCYGGISLENEDKKITRIPFFRQYTDEELKNVRNVDWHGTHLRTMKYEVFRNIPMEYLKGADDKLFDVSNDVAIMCSAIELAGPDRVGYFNFPTYIYRPPAFMGDNYVLNQSTKSTNSDNLIITSKTNEGLIKSYTPLRKIESFSNTTFAFALYVYGADMKETVIKAIKEVEKFKTPDVVDFILVELYKNSQHYEDVATQFNYRYVSLDISRKDTPNISTFGRNVAVLASSADFVIVNDADLLINKDFFTNIVDQAKYHKFFGSWSEINYLNQNGKGYEKTAKWIVGDYTHANGGSITVNRSFFVEMGGYDASYHGWGAEDNDFCFRASIKMGYAPICANNVITHMWHPSNAVIYSPDIRVSNNNLLYARIEKYTKLK